MKIKNYRIQANLTQRELATIVGITPEAICQYERVRRKPSIEVLKKLSLVLECTIDELVSDDIV